MKRQATVNGQGGDRRGTQSPAPGPIATRAGGASCGHGWAGSAGTAGTIDALSGSQRGQKQRRGACCTANHYSNHYSNPYSNPGGLGRTPARKSGRSRALLNLQRTLTDGHGRLSFDFVNSRSPVRIRKPAPDFESENRPRRAVFGVSETLLQQPIQQPAHYPNPEPVRIAFIFSAVSRLSWGRM